MADDDGRRFQMVRGESCQYKGVLTGVYVGMRIKLMDRWQREMMRMMEEEGIDVGEGFKVEEMYKWLGGLVEWGGMQASRICRVVYILSGMIQRMGGVIRREIF